MRFPLDLEAYLTQDDSNVIYLIDDNLTQIPYGAHCGAFGSIRAHDVHTGIDLYAPEGTPVYAIQSGTVVGTFPFTGKDAGCPWWLDTSATVVEDEDGIWLYGEITPNERLVPGLPIAEGECIGHVKRVLRNDKGRPVSMLHMERYTSGSREFGPVWTAGDPQPETLVDPTELLCHFDLDLTWQRQEDAKEQG